MASTGSIRKMTIFGATFDVAGDANFEFIPSAYEKENIPSSGRNSTKFTKRSQDLSGVELIMSAAEKELLSESVDAGTVGPISVQLASGQTYTTVGQINFETWSTEENRGSVTVLPLEGVNPWKLV